YTLGNFCRTPTIATVGGTILPRYFPLFTVIFRSAVTNHTARECGVQRHPPTPEASEDKGIEFFICLRPMGYAATSRLHVFFAFSRQKKWLRHLVLPSAFCCAEMLRLPCGVEPPSGFGSFFVTQKMRKCFHFRKSSFTDPFYF
ncbi:MAG: hypothetical protein IKA65_04590, partial [Lentisphaeria bacterium]|nr:hypothetical protein [Lentisphaeria bacterium]